MDEKFSFMETFKKNLRKVGVKNMDPDTALKVGIAEFAVEAIVVAGANSILGTATRVALAESEGRPVKSATIKIGAIITSIVLTKAIASKMHEWETKIENKIDERIAKKSEDQNGNSADGLQENTAE